MEKVDAQNAREVDISSAQKADISVGAVIGFDMIEGSKNAARQEHALTVREAVSQHKSAVFRAGFFCLPNMIIGYDPTILGTLVGIPEFRKQFGYEYPPGSDTFVLEASWTSAFN